MLSEVFLPFELEFTYGAAIHLSMTRTLFPNVADGEAWNHYAHTIFDEMIARGNRLAEVRKMELNQIDSMLHEVSIRVEQQGLQTLSLLFTPEQQQSQIVSHGQTHLERTFAATTDPLTTATTMPPMTEDSQSTPSALLQEPSSNLDFLDDMGISSYEFFSIVDQIGSSQDNFGVLDAGQGV